MATSSIGDPGSDRLRKLFAAGVKMAAAGSYDVAIELFAQCLYRDPGNAIYVENLLGVLSRKFDNNNLESRFESVSIGLSRPAIRRSLERREWTYVFRPGIDILKEDPWDIATLLALAQACEQLGFQDAGCVYRRMVEEAERQNEPGVY